MEYAKSQFSEELRKSMIQKIRKFTENNDQVIIINDKDQNAMKILE